MATTPTLFSLLDSLNFNVESGVELCGGDPDFYSELIRELYVDVLPVGAGLLSTSDLQKQRDYAHMLKGTLSTLGEQSASKTALELERSLREGPPDAVLARRLLQEIGRIQDTLSAVFDQ